MKTNLAPPVMDFPPDFQSKPEVPRAKPLGGAFGCPRDFLGNRFVYTVVSPRARGLSIGVNMNPDKYCNFNCVYCEVDRSLPAVASRVDTEVLAKELEATLDLVRSGRVRERSNYRHLPDELLTLRHVALSGDGEPTLCSNFLQIVETVIHLRASSGLPFFKLVLLTNASGLDQPGVVEGLRLLTLRDEVWAKFEAGTQDYMNAIARPDRNIDQTLENILGLARQRPVIIQSLFPAVNGKEPPASEIEAYVQRLKDLKDAGAQIPLVQIYSAARPSPNSPCSHLSLRSLSTIARRVREAASLNAEVF